MRVLLWFSRVLKRFSRQTQRLVRKSALGQELDRLLLDQIFAFKFALICGKICHHGNVKSCGVVITSVMSLVFQVFLPVECFECNGYKLGEIMTK